MEVVSDVLPLPQESIRGELAELMRSRAAVAVAADRYHHDGLVVALSCATNGAGQTLAEIRIDPIDLSELRTQAERRFDSEIEQKAKQSTAKNRSYYLSAGLFGVVGGLSALILSVVIGYFNGIGWGFAAWIGLTILVGLFSLPAYRDAQKLEDELKALRHGREEHIGVALEARKSQLRLQAISLRGEVEAMFKRVRFSAV